MSGSLSSCQGTELPPGTHCICLACASGSFADLSGTEKQSVIHPASACTHTSLDLGACTGSSLTLTRLSMCVICNEQRVFFACLQCEKEAQSSGEVKQLVGTVDQLSKRLVKDTTVRNNKKESLEAELAAAQQVSLTVVAGLAVSCWP